MPVFCLFMLMILLLQVIYSEDTAESFKGKIPEHEGKSREVTKEVGILALNGLFQSISIWKFIREMHESVFLEVMEMSFPSKVFGAFV